MENGKGRNAICEFSKQSKEHIGQEKKRKGKGQGKERHAKERKRTGKECNF